MNDYLPNKKRMNDLHPNKNSMNDLQLTKNSKNNIHKSSTDENFLSTDEEDENFLNFVLKSNVYPRPQKGNSMNNYMDSEQGNKDSMNNYMDSEQGNKDSMNNYMDSEQGNKDSVNNYMDSEQGNKDSMNNYIDSEQGNKDSMNNYIDSEQGNKDSMNNYMDSEQGNKDSMNNYMDSEQGNKDSMNNYIDSEQGNKDSMNNYMDSEQGNKDSMNNYMDSGPQSHDSMNIDSSRSDFKVDGSSDNAAKPSNGHENNDNDMNNNNIPQFVMAANDVAANIGSNSIAANGLDSNDIASNEFCKSNSSTSTCNKDLIMPDSDRISPELFCLSHMSPTQIYGKDHVVEYQRLYSRNSLFSSRNSSTLNTPDPIIYEDSNSMDMFYGSKYTKDSYENPISNYTGTDYNNNNSLGNGDFRGKKRKYVDTTAEEHNISKGTVPDAAIASFMNQGRPPDISTWRAMSSSPLDLPNSYQVDEDQTSQGIKPRCVVPPFQTSQLSSGLQPADAMNNYRGNQSHQDVMYANNGFGHLNSTSNVPYMPQQTYLPITGYGNQYWNGASSVQPTNQYVQNTTGFNYPQSMPNANYGNRYQASYRLDFSSPVNFVDPRGVVNFVSHPPYNTMGIARPRAMHPNFVTNINSCYPPLSSVNPTPGLYGQNYNLSVYNPVNSTMHSSVTTQQSTVYPQSLLQQTSSLNTGTQPSTVYPQSLRQQTSNIPTNPSISTFSSNPVSGNIMGYYKAPTTTNVSFNPTYTNTWNNKDVNNNVGLESNKRPIVDIGCNETDLENSDRDSGRKALKLMKGKDKLRKRINSVDSGKDIVHVAKSSSVMVDQSANKKPKLKTESQPAVTATETFAKVQNKYFTEIYMRTRRSDSPLTTPTVTTGTTNNALDLSKAKEQAEDKSEKKTPSTSLTPILPKIPPFGEPNIPVSNFLNVTVPTLTYSHGILVPYMNSIFAAMATVKSGNLKNTLNTVTKQSVLDTCTSSWSVSQANAGLSVMTGTKDPILNQHLMLNTSGGNQGNQTSTAVDAVSTVVTTTLSARTSSCQSVMTITPAPVTALYTAVTASLPIVNMNQYPLPLYTNQLQYPVRPLVTNNTSIAADGQRIQNPYLYRYNIGYPMTGVQGQVVQPTVTSQTLNNNVVQDTGLQPGNNQVPNINQVQNGNQIPNINQVPNISQVQYGNQVQNSNQVQNVNQIPNINQIPVPILHGIGNNGVPSVTSNGVGLQSNGAVQQGVIGMSPADNNASTPRGVVQGIAPTNGTVDPIIARTIPTEDSTVNMSIQGNKYTSPMHCRKRGLTTYQPIPLRGVFCEKPKPFKAKHYLFSSLQIGSYRYSCSSSSLERVARVKLLFSRKRLVYEYQLDGPSGDMTAYDDMVSIEVPFCTIVGLWLFKKDMRLEVNQPPKIFLGKKSTTKKTAYQSFGKNKMCIDITQGELGSCPYHYIQLKQSLADKIKTELRQFDARFETLLMTTLVEDHAKSLRPADRRIQSRLLNPTIQLPDENMNIQEHTETVYKPNEHHIVTQSTSCYCTNGCSHASCSCCVNGATCTEGLCSCENCRNPLNILYQLGLPAERARTDPCLMENIYKIRRLDYYLKTQVTLACCKVQVLLFNCIPGLVQCPYCPAQYKYSWCFAQVFHEQTQPRNHCVKCGRCTDYRNVHCKKCNVCYFAGEDKSLRCAECESQKIKATKLARRSSLSRNTGGRRNRAQSTDSVNSENVTLITVQNGVSLIKQNVGSVNNQNTAAVKVTCNQNMEAIDNQNKEALNNQNMQTIDNQNMESINNQNIEAIDNQNMEAIGNQNMKSIDNQNKEALNNQNMQTIDNQNMESINNQNIEAIDNQNMGAIGNQNMKSIDNQNKEALNNQNMQTIDNQNMESINNQNMEAIDNQNMEAIDTQNPDAIDNQNLEAIENQNLEAINNQNVEAIDNQNVGAIDNQNMEAIDSQNMGSIDIQNTEAIDISDQNMGLVSSGPFDLVSSPISDSHKNQNSAFISNKTDCNGSCSYTDAVNSENRNDLNRHSIDSGDCVNPDPESNSEIDFIRSHNENLSNTENIKSVGYLNLDTATVQNVESDANQNVESVANQNMDSIANQNMDPVYSENADLISSHYNYVLTSPNASLISSPYANSDNNQNVDSLSCQAVELDSSQNLESVNSQSVDSSSHTASTNCRSIDSNMDQDTCQSFDSDITYINLDTVKSQNIDKISCAYIDLCKNQNMDGSIYQSMDSAGSISNDNDLIRFQNLKYVKGENCNQVCSEDMIPVSNESKDKQSLNKVPASESHCEETVTSKNIDVVRNECIDLIASENIDLSSKECIDLVASENIDLSSKECIDLVASENIDTSSKECIDSIASENIDLSCKECIDSSSEECIDLVASENSKECIDSSSEECIDLVASENSKECIDSSSEECIDLVMSENSKDLVASENIDSVNDDVNTDLDSIYIVPHLINGVKEDGTAPSSIESANDDVEGSPCSIESNIDLVDVETSSMESNIDYGDVELICFESNSDLGDVVPDLNGSTRDNDEPINSENMEER